MGGGTAPARARDHRNAKGRRDAPHDRPRRLRGARPGRPRDDALHGRDDEGEDGGQKSEQRAISRTEPGTCGHDDERANPADDCLGRASARCEPAGTRVAAQRRIRENKGCSHCWICNAGNGLVQTGDKG